MLIFSLLWGGWGLDEHWQMYKSPTQARSARGLRERTKHHRYDDFTRRNQHSQDTPLQPTPTHEFHTLPRTYMGLGAWGTKATAEPAMATRAAAERTRMATD